MLIKEALTHFPLPALTCIGLVLFISVFVGAVFWVYRPGSRAFYEALERTPLQDGETQA
jgi:cbb3-type cytochrome oxidase subunit 3